MSKSKLRKSQKTSMKALKQQLGKKGHEQYKQIKSRLEQRSK